MQSWRPRTKAFWRFAVFSSHASLQSAAPATKKGGKAARSAATARKIIVANLII